MNKIIFFIYDILVRQPIEGTVYIYKGFQKYFNKKNNLLFIVVFLNFLLLIYSWLGPKDPQKQVPIVLTILSFVSFLFILFWKNITSGESNYRYNKYLNDKLRK